MERKLVCPFLRSLGILHWNKNWKDMKNCLRVQHSPPHSDCTECCLSLDEPVNSSLQVLMNFFGVWKRGLSQMSFLAVSTCEIQKGSAPRNKPEVLKQTKLTSRWDTCGNLDLSTGMRSCSTSTPCFGKEHKLCEARAVFRFGAMCRDWALHVDRPWCQFLNQDNEILPVSNI